MFRKHATSVPAELGGEIRAKSREIGPMRRSLRRRRSRTFTEVARLVPSGHHHRRHRLYLSVAFSQGLSLFLRIFTELSNGFSMEFSNGFSFL